jgi:hypothetical protein
MQTRLLDNIDGRRTFVVVLKTGDEVFNCLQQFVDDNELSAAHLSAIGAFRSAELRYFDWEARDYVSIPVDEQVEVASLNGDVALGPDGGREIHVHAVLGRRDGSAVAGHLGRAEVRPTLEVIVTESPAHLHKLRDPDTGLALIRPDVLVRF